MVDVPGDEGGTPITNTPFHSNQGYPSQKKKFHIKVSSNFSRFVTIYHHVRDLGTRGIRTPFWCWTILIKHVLPVRPLRSVQKDLEVIPSAPNYTG
jgi:hypothetical protein